ncbi:EPIDERMAL PATTERNING FACTOR-like protein 4 [Phalaenopsis equestris]|uniref:EPIDERMAL PATTERNING FACTOR-like protein 4 n=1 Tax=Phalaenopsis equestris TaxID=78828 RepID=UPI0009E5C76A|nr:EPIDERMAL PATTERNING FACTOR-like protein 4 [Phalaenopsis equestris]
MERIRRGRTRGGSLPMTTLLFCTYLCFFSTSALFSSNSHGDSPSGRGRSSRTATFIEGKETEMSGPEGGPGSYPPRCTSKCGDCSPCYPVHVPVPPGIPVIAEYYPEAWRCKCGNKLFMP